MITTSSKSTTASASSSPFRFPRGFRYTKSRKKERSKNHWLHLSSYVPAWPPTFGTSLIPNRSFDSFSRSSILIGPYGSADRFQDMSLGCSAAVIMMWPPALSNSPSQFLLKMRRLGEFTQQPSRMREGNAALVTMWNHRPRTRNEYVGSTAPLFADGANVMMRE